MRWQAEYGSRLKFLEKIAERGEMPAALASKPEPCPHAVCYFIAFQRLKSCCRSADDPIPFADMVAYAAAFGFDTLDARAELFRYVGACDRAFRERAAK